MARKTDVMEPEATTEALPEVDQPTGSATEGETEVTNLNDFWAAVDALEVSNPDFSSVQSEYGNLTRKGKMQATHGLKARTFAALDEDEYAQAKLLSSAAKALGTVSGTAGVSADPTEELVNRIAGIQLALTNLTETNPTLGDRVSAAVNAGINSDSIAAQLAKRLIETKMGRKSREGGGTRHNVGKHIAQVFADKESGTFLSVKDLSEANSAEYGDDVASIPSITTHLKNSFDQPGLEATEVDKKLGVRKMVAV